MRFRTSVRLAIGAALAGMAAGLAVVAEAAQTSLSLEYAVRLGGLSVGRVAVEATFVDGAYAVALSGRARGASMILSDAAATMVARGTFRGRQVLPAEYEVTMAEGGVTAEGRIAFRGRNVVDLEVLPGLTPNWDRVDLTMAHVRDVLDPLSAMIVSVGHNDAVSGDDACNRTIPVFDGWQRFDIVLRYDREEAAEDGPEGYSGRLIVCRARYVPVAGHRPAEPPVAYMTANERLEAWLMPVPGHPLLIPYQLVIGTEAGDLSIRLDRLSQR